MPTTICYSFDMIFTFTFVIFDRSALISEWFEHIIFNSNTVFKTYLAQVPSNDARLRIRKKWITESTINSTIADILYLELRSFYVTFINFYNYNGSKDKKTPKGELLIRCSVLCFTILFATTFPRKNNFISFSATKNAFCKRLIDFFVAPA